MMYKRRKDGERRRFEKELNEVLCRSGVGAEQRVRAE